MRCLGQLLGKDGAGRLRKLTPSVMPSCGSVRKQESVWVDNSAEERGLLLHLLEEGVDVGLRGVLYSVQSVVQVVHVRVT